MSPFNIYHIDSSLCLSATGLKLVQREKRLRERQGLKQEDVIHEKTLHYCTSRLRTIRFGKEICHCSHKGRAALVEVTRYGRLQKYYRMRKQHIILYRKEKSLKSYSVLCAWADLSSTLCRFSSHTTQSIFQTENAKGSNSANYKGRRGEVIYQKIQDAARKAPVIHIAAACEVLLLGCSHLLLLGTKAMTNAKCRL